MYWEDTSAILSLKSVPCFETVGVLSFNRDLYSSVSFAASRKPEPALMFCITESTNLLTLPPNSNVATSSALKILSA